MRQGYLAQKQNNVHKNSNSAPFNAIPVSSARAPIDVGSLAMESLLYGARDLDIFFAFLISHSVTTNQNPAISFSLASPSDAQLGTNLEMVPIDTVRESNAQGNVIDGLIAVFVGGTGGIGESTAKEFFKRTTRPIAYIVGRSLPANHFLSRWCG